jgi:glutamate racemase
MVRSDKDGVIMDYINESMKRNNRAIGRVINSAAQKQYVEQNIAFLKQQGVKAVVVACSSASSVLTGTDDFGLPVFTVIEPGADAALRAAPRGPIGVLGTQATVSASAYPRAIATRGSGVPVFQQAAPLLVPLVEEGWIDDAVTAEVLRRYLEPLLQQDIRALILGCTHYPALKGPISRIAGSGIALIDSAETVANRLALAIQTGQVAPNSPRTPNRPDSDRFRFCLTDRSPSFLRIAERLLASGNTRIQLPEPELVTL